MRGEVGKNIIRGDSDPVVRYLRPNVRRLSKSYYFFDRLRKRLLHSLNDSIILAELQESIT
jgi:hypothetical protein